MTTVAIAVLPVVLASCSSNSASSSPTTTTSATTTTLNPAETTTTSKSGLVPSMYAPDPKVTVTPSRDLENGQKVTVSVTGFDSGGKFFISECASASDANSAGCGPELAAQPFGVINNTKGIGSYPFSVSTTAAAKPEGKATVQCTHQCVIVATVGIGYGYAYAPIEFANGVSGD
ncbi:MAG: hypothetical protein EPN30_05260 [Actinomycetota bacterium]|nr:MAG: hypothetical protein EPN30_05260 [Actinomycetota bacterium]